MYGLVQEIPQKETTPFYPRSPYGKWRRNMGLRTLVALKLCVMVHFSSLFTLPPLKVNIILKTLILKLVSDPYSPAAGGSPAIFFSALSFLSDFDRGTHELSIHHG